MAEAHIQWQGSSACLDFECSCGWRGHVDVEAPFSGFLECSHCGAVWELSATIELTEWGTCHRRPVTVYDMERIGPVSKDQAVLDGLEELNTYRNHPLTPIDEDS